MIADLDALADALLANFRTVRISPPVDAQPTSGGLLAQGKANLAARRAAQAYRDRLRQELLEQGSRRFFDYLEADPDGGWRLHIFAADDPALTFLNRLEECEAGDSATFDPEDLVRDRLADGRWAGEFR